MSEKNIEPVIPLTKATITRQDMEAVLECLVYDRLTCEDISKTFTEQLAHKFGCNGGVVFRTYKCAAQCCALLLAERDNQKLGLSPLADETWHITMTAHGIESIYMPILSKSFLVDADTLNEYPYDAFLASTPYGYIEDIARIRERCDVLIEDIGAGIGGAYGNAPVGHYGDIVIISLEVEDILTTGGGAAIFARSRKDAMRLRKIAAAMSTKNLLPDYNAALGLTQLKRLEEYMQHRRMYAKQLTSAIRPPHTAYPPPYSQHHINTFLMVHLATNIAEVKRFIRAQNIECADAFPTAVARTVPEALPKNILDTTLDALNKGLTMPLYPALLKRDITKIERVLANLP